MNFIFLVAYGVVFSDEFGLFSRVFEVEFYIYETQDLDALFIHFVDTVLIFYFICLFVINWNENYKL